MVRTLGILANVSFIASIPTALMFALLTLITLLGGMKAHSFLDVGFLFFGWWGLLALAWSWAKFEALSFARVRLWVWGGYVAGVVEVLWYWTESPFSIPASIHQWFVVLLFGGAPLLLVVVILAKLLATGRPSTGNAHDL